MSTALSAAVQRERLAAIDSPAPASLVRAGQTWQNSAPHCYKCHHFKDNKHCTGRCALGVISGEILSMDMGVKTGCMRHYAPKWTAERGLIDAPIQGETA